MPTQHTAPREARTATPPRTPSAAFAAAVALVVLVGLGGHTPAHAETGDGARDGDDQHEAAERAYDKSRVLDGTAIRWAWLRDANLSDTSLNDADLREARLEGTDLSGSSPTWPTPTPGRELDSQRSSPEPAQKETPT